MMVAPVGRGPPLLMILDVVTPRVADASEHGEGESRRTAHLATIGVA
jgi:hypothetical protein